MILEGVYGSFVDEKIPPIREACRASKPTRNAHNDLPGITVVLVDDAMMLDSPHSGGRKPQRQESASGYRPGSRHHRTSPVGPFLAIS